MDNNLLLPSTETLRRFHERAFVLYEQPTEPLKRLRHTAKRDISKYSAHEEPPNDREFKARLVSLLQRSRNSKQSLKASRRIRRYIDQWSRWVRVGISGHAQLISSTQTWLPALY